MEELLYMIRIWNSKCSKLTRVNMAAPKVPIIGITTLVGGMILHLHPINDQNLYVFLSGLMGSALSSVRLDACSDFFSNSAG